MNSLFYGERVRLTALRSDDAATMARWYEDGEFARLFDASPAYPKTDSAMMKRRVARRTNQMRGSHRFRRRLRAIHRSRWRMAR